MSAFMVSFECVNRAVSLWMTDEYGQMVSWDEHNFSMDDCDALGREMLRLNREALAARYPGEDMGAPTDEEIAAWSWDGKRYGRVDASKALHCVIYQCSEGDIPEKSVLWQRMKRRAAETDSWIVSQLPEWEAAEWG
jgi:hypothetical protein